MTNLIINYLLNLEGFNSFSLESFLYFITRSFIIPIIFIIAIIALEPILLALFSITDNLINKTYPDLIKADVKLVAVLSLILGMIFSVLSVLYPVEEGITQYFNKELDQHNLKIEFNGAIQIFKSSKELESNLVDISINRRYVKPEFLGSISCGEKTLKQCLELIKLNKESILALKSNNPTGQNFVLNIGK